MSQISQLSISLSIHRLSLPVIHLPLSLPQLPVPQQPNLLLGHFCDKRLFLPFLPAPDTKQRWQQCLWKSVADIIYSKSSFGRASASGPSTREVGLVGCNEQKGTEPVAKSQSSLRHCRYKSACFLRCVVESGSSVIGSGAHMTVAPVDNARDFVKHLSKVFTVSLQSKQMWSRTPLNHIAAML